MTAQRAKIYELDLFNNIFVELFLKFVWPEAVTQRCSVKKKIFFKKETLAQAFSCEFCEISKNNFSYKTPPAAASVWIFPSKVICYLWYSNWFKNETSLTLEANSEICSEPCQTSNIEVFAQIVNGIKFLTIFAKSFILDVWQDSEFASKARYDFAEKAPFHMFDRILNSPLITSKNLQPSVIFAKLVTISLLNLINITVLCMVKSTWPYDQHICLITKIMIVFPNHVFLDRLCLHISHMRISQKIKGVIMWNLQHTISIWSRWLWPIFKSALVYL